MKRKTSLKKMTASLLTALIISSLTACGAGQKQPDAGNTEEESGTEEMAAIPTALTLLDTVWESYGEEEKFPVAGGDFSEEHAVMDGPGEYHISDPASLDAALGMPQSCVAKIDGAASLTHMMNANTFTCGAFHVSTSEDVSAVADALKENILNRQWMCGFPDKLLIFTVGDYVVSAFGNEELLDTFKSKLTAAYETAVLVYEEPIV